MGWFDEQIRQRKQSDQDVFEDSMLNMASVVLGRSRVSEMADERVLTKAALDDVLKYYHITPVEVPETVTDVDEQMEFCLRPHGIMRRNVKLEEGWYKDAFGPMLTTRRSDGCPVALLPLPFAGYRYRDPDSGKMVKIDKKNAALLDSEAICFYRPLPLKKLGVADLVKYMIECLEVSDILLVVGLTLAATLVGMILTPVTKSLTGFVNRSGSVPLLMGTAVFMFSCIVSAQIIGVVRSLAMNRLEIKTSLPVEAALMMRILNLPANFFRKYSSGELSSRFESVKELCSMLVSGVFATGLGSLMSLLYVTQIFRFAPALVAPALVILLISVVMSVLASLLQMKIGKATMENAAKESGLSYALITGVQKIKLAGAEKRAFARWANAYATVTRLVYDPPLLLKVSSPIQTAISLAGTIVLYYIAASTRVSPSDYIAFNTAYGTVTGAFAALTGVALSVANIKPVMDMAEPLLKTEPESSENKSMVTSLSGSIELSNVYFRYTDSMPYVVDGMSLKIRAGEYIAIVGTTGCGKSTLVRLLLGFETPERGAIYYDGKDMSKLDLRSLRRRIGSVTQDGALFQGDIYSNIVISAPQLTLDDAWAAAEMADIADDIRAMPMGMQTIISEGQGGISGGQKQRLMIARAVAPKPKILIFDEATSALDNKTQKKVSDALDKLKCTRIVIAHRLSTIRHCDRILVLDKGHIMEDGTYDELIAKNGMFAALVARQRLDT